MAYKKVGGLHFFTLGRFGITFYLKRRHPKITASSIGRAVQRKLDARASELSFEFYDRGYAPGKSAALNPYFER